MNTTILIPLADGFEEIEAITQIDLLRRSEINVITAALSNIEVEGSHGIVVKADTLLSDLDSEIDGIVIPGGMPGTKHLRESERLLNIIKKTFSEGKLCAAICAAPTVLFKAEVLTGKQYTCYPGFQNEITGADFTDEDVVISENIITGRGVGVAIQFALAVVEYLVDTNVADDLANKVVFS